MRLECENCKTATPLTGRVCLVCDLDIGFPNVRAAQTEEERAAMFKRFVSAWKDAKTAGLQARVRGLVQLAKVSQIIMNRRLGPLFHWLSGDDPYYRTFHHQVAMGRQPKKDDWDPQRGTAESAVNPYCYQDISFAALSPDGRGLSYYGEYTVTLKNEIVAQRASLFEKNPFLFLHEHNIVGGKAVPHGYRATWYERRNIAVAKLTKEVIAKPHLADEEIFLGPDGKLPDCDFIEVHIHGDIHREAIASVEGPRPVDPIELIFWDKIKTVLTNQGAVVKEV